MRRLEAAWAARTDLDHQLTDLRETIGELQRLVLLEAGSWNLPIWYHPTRAPSSAYLTRAVHLNLRRLVDCRHSARRATIGNRTGRSEGTGRPTGERRTLRLVPRRAASRHPAPRGLARLVRANGDDSKG